MSRAKVESIGGIAAERARIETEARQRADREDQNQAKTEALSLKLWHLTQVTRLAAFAAESRRTLRGIKSVMHFRPEMQQVISDGMDCQNTWIQMKDTTGNVLDHVADQLEELNIEFTDLIFGEVKVNGVDAGEERKE